MRTEIEQTFKSVWAILGFNTATLATVELIDIELILKIILLIVTIISTVVLKIYKMRKNQGKN